MTEIKNGEKQFFPTRLPHDLKNGHNDSAQQPGQVKHTALKQRINNTKAKEELCSHYY